VTIIDLKPNKQTTPASDIALTQALSFPRPLPERTCNNASLSCGQGKVHTDTATGGLPSFIENRTIDQV